MREIQGLKGIVAAQQLVIDGADARLQQENAQHAITQEKLKTEVDELNRFCTILEQVILMKIAVCSNMLMFAVMLVSRRE